MIVLLFVLFLSSLCSSCLILCYNEYYTMCDVQIYLLFNLQNFDRNLLILRLKCAFRNEMNLLLKRCNKKCKKNLYVLFIIIIIIMNERFILIFHLSTYFMYTYKKLTSCSAGENKYS